MSYPVSTAVILDTLISWPKTLHKTVVWTRCAGASGDLDSYCPAVPRMLRYQCRCPRKSDGRPQSLL